MPRFTVENRATGIVFGIYEGATAADAIDAMARDAGYRDQAHALETVGDDGSSIIATPVEAIRVGDRVECEDDGHDEGVVHAIDGDVATVGWKSGARTPVLIERLTRA